MKSPRQPIVKLSSNGLTTEYERRVTGGYNISMQENYLVDPCRRRTILKI
jgi:hypothetical protein